MQSNIFIFSNVIVHKKPMLLARCENAHGTFNPIPWKQFDRFHISLEISYFKQLNMHSEHLLFCSQPESAVSGAINKIVPRIRKHSYQLMHSKQFLFYKYLLYCSYHIQ